ncbi:integrin alpha-4-like [Ctenocephalides felis]|uniref:integrin alpha-4-like n=1 Tax=Ctenocephalides felis TaxID=7515 RepID=UPI000E6E230B|nr:integrin alpha-4-like [Ctenocephalides felis]
MRILEFSVAIRENWIQVGAPKGSNLFLPQVTDPGAVYKCPFKNSCNVIDINSMNTPGKDHRKANGWLGGAMDVSTSTHSYAVCSHRMINQKWNSYYMIGSCYWGHSQANMQPQYVMTPLDDHEIYTLQESTANSNPVSVYDWGNGLAGMSVHIPKNLTNGNMQLVIGAPGVFNLRGAVILYRNLERGLGQPLVTNPYKTVGGPIDDDYVGYQVSSGYFYNRDKVLYVASAPRSMYKGKVIIFEFARTTREAMIIKQELVGQTIGEYFGASVTSGDLDNDGLDDLVVGAPQWSSVEDEGRIYVYMGSNTGRLSLSISFDGSVKGAMFGYAVQFLGDVDGDGYNDLAVGAPYDDDFRGALYVYYGGPSGLSAARSTRISASVLSPELKGFGVSFSKAEDLDNNGYGDFAVGSFISGHAVLLRSKPVMDVVVSIKTKSNSLDHSATQFEIDLCVFYSGRGLPTDMVVIRNVSADAAFGRVTLSKTGRFQNEANVKVAINRETCETITFDLKVNISIFKMM